ncbi:MAG: GNAT family N-acetyltransferase [Spirochaetota bacterium]
MDEQLYALGKHDASKAGVVLNEAFCDDPLWAALFAGETNAEEKRRAFFEAPVRYCLRYGNVVASSDRLEGIAAWVPGEYAEMTLWRMIRCGSLRTGMRMGASVARKLGRVFEQPIRDRQEHMRDVPYAYLQVIGVSPAHQGRGVGGRLLRHVIEDCDARNRALYLETETESNVGFYERFGFRLLKRIVLPDVGLPLWEMARTASR